MSDDRLGRELRSLPRARTSPAFRARVLAEIQADSRRRSLRSPSWAALAVASAVVLALVLGGTWERHRDAPADDVGSVAEQRRLESLRREYASLQRELD